MMGFSRKGNLSLVFRSFGLTRFLSSMTLNPLFTNRFVHPYHLDESISILGGYGGSLQLFYILQFRHLFQSKIVPAFQS